MARPGSSTVRKWVRYAGVLGPLALACAQSATLDDTSLTEPPLDADVPAFDAGPTQQGDTSVTIDAGVDTGRDAGIDTGASTADVVTVVDTGIVDAGVDSPPPCGKVVVNELMSQGASAADEFVELYNPNACTAMLNGYKLMYSSAGGSTPSAMITFTAAHTIPAGGYLTVTGASFVGDAGTSAVSASLGLAAAAGRVGLIDPAAKVVDSVAYGTQTAGTVYIETAAGPSPPTSKSIGRKPNGADTDNNSVDFQVLTAPTPGYTN